MSTQFSGHRIKYQVSSSKRPHIQQQHPNKKPKETRETHRRPRTKQKEAATDTQRPPTSRTTQKNNTNKRTKNIKQKKRNQLREAFCLMLRKHTCGYCQGVRNTLSLDEIELQELNRVTPPTCPAKAADADDELIDEGEVRIPCTKVAVSFIQPGQRGRGLHRARILDREFSARISALLRFEQMKSRPPINRSRDSKLERRRHRSVHARCRNTRAGSRRRDNRRR